MSFFNLISFFRFFQLFFCCLRFAVDLHLQSCNYLTSKTKHMLFNCFLVKKKIQKLNLSKGYLFKLYRLVDQPMLLTMMQSVFLPYRISKICFPMFLSTNVRTIAEVFPNVACWRKPASHADEVFRSPQKEPLTAGVIFLSCAVHRSQASFIYFSCLIIIFKVL